MRLAGNPGIAADDGAGDASGVRDCARELPRGLPGDCPEPRPAEASRWLRVEIHIGHSHEGPQRQVVQAVPATVKLLADLVTNLLDLLRLQHLDDPRNRMPRGPGLPGKNSPAVRDGHARLSIRLLGDDNCRTVKKRNMRGKDRHTKAAFPRLVSRIAVCHSCPPVLSTDHAGPLDCRPGPPGPAPPRPRSRAAITYLLSGRPCV